MRSAKGFYEDGLDELSGFVESGAMGGEEFRPMHTALGWQRVHGIGNQKDRVVGRHHVLGKRFSDVFKLRGNGEKMAFGDPSLFNDSLDGREAVNDLAALLVPQRARHLGVGGGGPLLDAAASDGVARRVAWGPPSGGVRPLVNWPVA